MSAIQAKFVKVAEQFVNESIQGTIMEFLKSLKPKTKVSEIDLEMVQEFLKAHNPSPEKKPRDSSGLQVYQGFAKEYRSKNPKPSKEALASAWAEVKKSLTPEDKKRYLEIANTKSEPSEKKERVVSGNAYHGFVHEFPHDLTGKERISAAAKAWKEVKEKLTPEQMKKYQEIANEAKEEKENKKGKKKPKKTEEKEEPEESKENEEEVVLGSDSDSD